MWSEQYFLMHFFMGKWIVYLEIPFFEKNTKLCLAARTYAAILSQTILSIENKDNDKLKAVVFLLTRAYH